MRVESFLERLRIHARVLIAVPVVVCALLAAGCGPDDGNDTAGESPSPGEQSESTAQDDGGGDGDGSAGAGEGKGSGGGGSGGGGNGKGGGNGGGKGNGGGGAPGAPINVPAKIADQGAPLSYMLPFVKAGVREQCGGSMCVKVKVEHRVDTYCSSKFVFSEPSQRTPVKRGGTIVLVAGSKDCPDEGNGDGGGTGDGGTGDGGTGDGGTGDGGTGEGDGGGAGGGDEGGGGEGGELD